VSAPVGPIGPEPRSPQLAERWGAIEKMSMKHGGHSIDYDQHGNFAHLLMGDDSTYGGAEGGYVLIRFDVDDEPCTCVHVDGLGGWWALSGGNPSPVDTLERSAEYLTALASRLRAIDSLCQDAVVAEVDR
jgi:hypothetical protein